jgi:MFS family permease
MVIPLAGWMSERFGAKRVWLVSVTLFGLGSALCGLASSAGMLIFFRVLQGFGGGMIMPVAMSVLAQTAGPNRLGRVMSVIGVPTLLGPILGPVLGGFIIDSTTWRLIFYVNVPIAIVGLILAVRLLPDDTGRADAGRLDWVGLGLISPGLAGIVFGLSETESHGGITPLYYQVARGQSALTAGLLMAPQGLGAAVSLAYAGRLADRVGGGRVALVGCSIMTLATLPLVAVGAGTSFVLLAGVLFVRGMGLGAAMMPAISAAYARLDSAQVPRATSAVNVLQRVGGSISTALLAVVLQSETRSAVAGGTGSAGLQPVPPALRERLADPLASAFGHTFAWAAGLRLLAVIAAGVLAWSERADEDASAQHQPSERAHARAAAAT